MVNPFEKAPGKNREKKITCPICNDKQPERDNCGRCKGKGYIIDRN